MAVREVPEALPEVIAELGRLTAIFTEADYDRLENALVLRSYVLGWTGDPLKQPAETVLACARQVLAEKTAAVQQEIPK